MAFELIKHGRLDHLIYIATMGHHLITWGQEVKDGKAFVPRLVRELTAPVDTVSMRRPSLDDVFLKLTGRAIRDEEVSARDRNRAMASRWMGRRR